MYKFLCDWHKLIGASARLDKKVPVGTPGYFALNDCARDGVEDFSEVFHALMKILTARNDWKP